MHNNSSLDRSEAEMTKETGSQLASTSGTKPVGEEQQQTHTPAPAFSNDSRIRRPNLPTLDPVDDGPIEDYHIFVVPLYEASIKCDWKAAEAILEVKPELIRSKITKNGETALHVAATVKESKLVEKFVKNLVGKMQPEDLELENEEYMTALYMAASAGNTKTVKIMVEKHSILTTIPGGAQRNFLPMFAAASLGKYEVVKYLYTNSNNLRDEVWNDVNRCWLLERCVEADMFDIALKIVNAYSELDFGSVLGILARKPDAFSGKESEALELLTLIWTCVAKKSTKDIDAILRGPPDSKNLIQTLPRQKLILKHLGKLEVETENIMVERPDVTRLDKAMQLHRLFYEHLGNIHAETENLIKQNDERFSHNRDLTPRTQKLISEHIENTRDELRNLNLQAYAEEEQPRYLHKFIFKHITKMRNLSGSNTPQYSSRVLFIAAEMGNTKFLIELIRRYPDLMWKINDDKQTIFHIAVKYRHEGIYNLLYEVGSMKDTITPIKDADHNNMLHLAGKATMKERLADVSGAALQMQRELLWFKEVRDMVPPSSREAKNKDGLTPRQLFSEEHKELIREGEKWMKDTASQCMVVAALIATIVFAAAFTIPGGYNQDNGIPIFYRKPIFVAFVVADAMSLFLSSTSILTFLSILTSRFAEHNFMESLPKKLLLGISTLFLSITAMMITFSVSFFILYHKHGYLSLSLCLPSCPSSYMLCCNIMC